MVWRDDGAVWRCSGQAADRRKESDSLLCSSSRIVRVWLRKDSMWSEERYAENNNDERLKLQEAEYVLQSTSGRLLIFIRRRRRRAKDGIR